jgi:hypothetical protein
LCGSDDFTIGAYSKEFKDFTDDEKNEIGNIAGELCETPPGNIPTQIFWASTEKHIRWIQMQRPKTGFARLSEQLSLNIASPEVTKSSSSKKLFDRPVF